MIHILLHIRCNGLIYGSIRHTSHYGDIKLISGVIAIKLIAIDRLVGRWFVESGDGSQQHILSVACVSSAITLENRAKFLMMAMHKE